jgi:hypothetical protein
MIISAPSPIYYCCNNQIFYNVYAANYESMKSAQPVTLYCYDDEYKELDLNIWYGVYAPAGVDLTTRARINNLINQELKNPVYAEQLKNIGIINPGGTFEDLVRIQGKNLNILKNVSKHIE